MDLDKSFLKAPPFLPSMEIKILESTDKRMIVEVPGETTTICNVLVAEMWNNKHTVSAAFRVEHPLVSNPQIILDTDGEKPDKTLKVAAANIIKKNEALKKVVKSMRV